MNKLPSRTLPLLQLLCATAALAAPPPDHNEFDAMLAAPAVLTEGAPAAIAMQFRHPGAGPEEVRWQLDITGPAGRILHRQRGRATLQEGGTTVTLDVPPLPTAPASSAASSPTVQLRLSAWSGGQAVQQQASARLAGQNAARVAFGPSPPLPYTIFYGNLHSQTNHSDGGAPLSACHGAQHPQSAPFGPEHAFDYAREHGLDFLMASEHNHMYDGDEGSNLDADPTQARALYQVGLAQAALATERHPGFVALYGMEWGVISNGGHLNILNSSELLGWERNRSGQLLADTATAKGSYAPLYKLMRERGWLGQFNHPKGASSASAAKTSAIPPMAMRPWRCARWPTRRRFPPAIRKANASSATSKAPASGCWKRAITWPLPATRTTIAPTGAPHRPTAPPCWCRRASP